MLPLEPAHLRGLLSAASGVVVCTPAGAALSAPAARRLWEQTLELERVLGASRYGGRALAVGYRPFVRDLISETFRGLQEASKAQVRAYQELLQAACRAATATDARLLCTLVLMGLQRITVSDGSIDARVRLLLEALSADAGSTPALQVANAAADRLAETGRVAVRFHTETLSPSRFTSRSDWPRLAVR